MTESADLLLWPDTVAAFYADRACSIRSAATRKTWGYTYRMLQRRHPGKPVGLFTTDDLVAFVTQRGWDTPRWSSATARNYRIAMQSLFGWAHHAERITIDPAWRLGQLVRIRRVRTWQPHWLTETQIAALLRTVDGNDTSSQRDRSLLMLGLFAGLRTGELHRLRWCDVDVDHGIIEVVGKGAKPGTVVMPPQLDAQVRRWHAAFADEHGFESRWPVVPVLAAPYGDKASITVRQPVKALSIEGIRQVINRHGSQIGVAYLRPHDLRRTLAGTLDARGGCRCRTSESSCATTRSTRPRRISPTTRCAFVAACTHSRSNCDHFAAWSFRP